MKINKIFIVLLSIFLVLIVGCANGIKNEGNKIVVEKRVGESDKYEYYNEVKDNKEVQNIKDILDSIDWGNAKVKVSLSSPPPDYKFHFEYTTEKQESNGLIYDLWISPDKGTIELVINSESKYIHMDKAKSAELYKLITGKNLDDV